MKIRQSTFKDAKTCWRKAFNKHHRKLDALARPQKMTDGTALHTGLAALRAGKSLADANGIMLQKFTEETKDLPILKEQRYLLDDNRELLQVMLFKVYEAWEDQGYPSSRVTVIQPECHFEIPIPNSHHNCIWLHHYNTRLKAVISLDNLASELGITNIWSDPEDILNGYIHPYHHHPDPKCFCWTPHILKGTTDTIIKMNDHMWIEEHKFTSIKRDQFFDQYFLDIQPTLYMWAIQQTLGIKVAGFIMNGMFRPSENQVAAWNAKRKKGPPKTEKDYLRYERQFFTRTDEDLQRAVQAVKELCDEWEWRITQGYFSGTFGGNACMNYNSHCPFWNMCLSHDRDTNALTTIKEPVNANNN